MIDLDEIMRLREAATPGPWKVNIGDFESEDGYGTVTAPYVEADGKTICVPFDRGPDDDNDEDDAAYIVAACNAVPELVARIRELEEQLDVNEMRMKKAGDVFTKMLKAMHKITDTKENEEGVQFKQVSALEPCRIVSNNNSTPPE